MRYALAGLLLVLLAGIAAAHTITMNLAVNINGDKNASVRFNDTDYSALAANSSTVLLLHLDNSTLDSSSYGNNGTSSANCSANVTARVNSGCLFDGSTSYINVTDNNVLDVSQNITLSAWVNYTPSGRAWKAIISKQQSYQLLGDNGDGSDDRVPQFALYIDSDWTRLTAASGLSAGIFHHIAATYNGSLMVLYVDGSHVMNKSQTGLLNSNSFNFSIGHDANGVCGAVCYFNGTIDEAVIYNVALGADEVNNIYAYGLSKPLDLVLDTRYVSASSSNTTAALVSTGDTAYMRFNNTYNSTHILFQMTQNSEGRFLLAVFNGSYANVDNKLSMIDAFKMVSSAFGNYATGVPNTFRTFIRLQYSDIDLDGRASWSGNGQLRITNRGKTSRGLPNITLEVVR